MARSRIIKPEFWSDEKLSKVSLQARLVFIGLWTTADDAGTTKGHPVWLKSQIFPYDEITIKQFETWLNELIHLKRVLPYDVNGEKYLYIPGFIKHQKISHPSPAKNPVPPETFRNYSGEALEQTETEFKQNIKKICGQKIFVPPSLDQVKEYCKQRNNRVDPEKWFHHYQSNGWKVGKNSMKSWQSAVITWEKSDIGNSISIDEYKEPRVPQKPRYHQNKDGTWTKTSPDGTISIVDNPPPKERLNPVEQLVESMFATHIN